LDKLLRKSKDNIFIQDDMMRFSFARTLMIINSITMGRQIMSQSQVHGKDIKMVIPRISEVFQHVLKTHCGMYECMEFIPKFLR
jgi:hypothetical protein